jgi:hypothetical protein
MRLSEGLSKGKLPGADRETPILLRAWMLQQPNWLHTVINPFFRVQTEG